MTIPEAEKAMKEGVLVGTRNVQSKGGFCLFSTGHLIKMVKVKGKKEKEFLFRDRWAEIEIIRPASVFSFLSS